MKCMSCLYPLWRIRSRQCPECGAPFKPSSYEFVLNSVRFCCPHCDQEYYGDGERGHLNPVEFDCVKCGTHIHMDEMVLSPAAGVEEERTEVEKLPWLERGRIGWWRSWIRTVGLALISPREAMKMTPVESSGGQAIRFFVWTQMLVMLVTFIPMLLIIGIFGFIGASAAGGGPGGAGGGGPGAGAIVGIVSGAFGAMLLGAMLASMVFFGVFTLVAHGIMAITGPTFGLKRTLHAMAYSSGANVATAAPCIGGYVGWIWWLVSAVIMVKEAHAARWWRAVLAVAGPVLGTLAVFVAVYVGFVLTAMTAAQQSVTTAQQAAEIARARALGAAMTATATRDAQWPRHAVQLVLEGQASAGDFVAGQTMGPGASRTQAALVPIGGLTLGSLKSAGNAEQAAAIDQEVAARAGEAAYRVGDMVVCLRAGDPVNPPAGTWLLIVWPDPAHNAAEPGQVLVVGADGSSASIAAADFDAAFKGQNELRAGAGLKPLPHPREVKSAAPSEKGPEGP